MILDKKINYIYKLKILLEYEILITGERNE